MMNYYNLCREVAGRSALYCLSCFITDTAVKDKAGSSWSGNSSPPLLLSFLFPGCVSLAGGLQAEGLCADVPGERPAPLPWKNMWSGSVYAGTLSSCLPHSMLASVSPGWHAQPSSHKGGILRLKSHQQSCWFMVLTNRRRRSANKESTHFLTLINLKESAILLHRPIVYLTKRSRFYNYFFYFLFLGEFKNFMHVFHRCSTFLTFSQVFLVPGKHLKVPSG